jgi:hypothetical protein
MRRNADESNKLFYKAVAKGLTKNQVFEKMSLQGIFVLSSSKRLETSLILPIYYTMQEIEQVFDIGKKYSKMIPLRVQGEGTFLVHLLLAFTFTTSTAIIKMLQRKLIGSPYNPLTLFLNRRNHKCKVLVIESFHRRSLKKANDCNQRLLQAIRY